MSFGDRNDGREEAPPERLQSLDAFRGLAIAGMILVNNPGSWSHMYAPLKHAEWHGMTPTDLIFPFFLFAIGASMPFSMASRRKRGDTDGALLVHVARRALILYGLGLGLTLFPFFRFETVRLVGVLARIAFVYGIAGALVVLASRRVVWAVGACCLLGYWALMTWVPVPGFGAGDLSPEGNLAAWLDRTVLGVHMWTGGGGLYDPEGLLSTLPAVGSTLIGLFAGDILRSSRSEHRKTVLLSVCGVALLLTGWLWSQSFPLNKKIWTSSYTVYTGGWAFLTIGFLYYVIDVLGANRWSKPLVVYGSNAILVFVGSGLVAKTLIYTTVGTGGDSLSVYGWIYRTVFLSWATPINASLGFAVATVLCWLGVAWFLYRKRVFLKV